MLQDDVSIDGCAPDIDHEPAVYPVAGSRNIEAVMERYRLEPVRDAREREERTRKGTLAVAVDDAKASEAAVAAAAARVAAAEHALARAGTSVPETSALALVRRDRFVTKLRRALELAREEHDRAVAAHAGSLASVDAARARLVRARADREVIERHFARWREARAKLAERRAD